MLTLLTPFKNLARWCQKLVAPRAFRTAEASEAREQEHAAHGAASGEAQPLAGKWPDQNDLMTRLTAPGRVIRLNGTRTTRDADNHTHETRVHDESRIHNVYKFPGLRS